MSKYYPRLDPASIEAEFAGADLGDERLLKRLTAVVETMAASPESSFAAMSNNEAEREGLCRFVRNPRIDAAALLEPHIGNTAQRAQEARQVLVLHDTTQMALSEHADLKSFLQEKRKGFLAHVSLVVDANQDRCPLGVIALETLERKKVSKLKVNGRSMTGNETTKLKDRESQRWMRGVATSSEMLTEVEEVINVIDAEGDSYEFLAGMVQAGNLFVVRQCHNRRAKPVAAGAESAHIRDLLEHIAPYKTTREVHVSKRRGKRAPHANKAHPARDARTAQLSFSHTMLVVRRPVYHTSLPEELRLNVVRVFENSPPSDVEPIEWLLLTNLQISSKVDAERVVDIYRQRWLIEEYFKALKTGCNMRKRKLLNRDSIYNTLALFMPIASRALALRHVARDVAARASVVLSPLELKVLRAKAKREKTPLPTHPTANQALLFLAQLGGHRKSNGPPGWATLMRGFHRFDAIVEGWALREL